jgi:hypothetical protein
MFKKVFHYFLVGMLLFSSFGPFLSVFAQEEQESDFSVDLPSIDQDTEEALFLNTEEIVMDTTGQESLILDIPERDEDIYINYEHSTDQLDVLKKSVVEENIVDPKPDFSLFSSEIASLQTLSTEHSTLKITEVYRLSSYEWIEITNLDDSSFVGDITLNGAKASTFPLKNITIPAHSSVIIADDKVVGIIDTGMFISSDAGLNFTDGNPINIELLVDGVLQDTFNVDSTMITAYKGQAPRPSFEKLYDNGEWKIEATLLEHTFNAEGIIANP